MLLPGGSSVLIRKAGSRGPWSSHTTRVSLAITVVDFAGRQYVCFRNGGYQIKAEKRVIVGLWKRLRQ